jgi:hypothetical protein
MQRDTLVLIGLFVGLAALIALGPARSASMPGGGSSSHVSGESGALALYRWLDTMGYDVARVQYAEFAPDPEAELLLVLGPTVRYTPDEAEAVAAWVAAGGTLLVAENRAGAFGMSAELLELFGLRVVAWPEGELPPVELPVLQPAFAAPPTTVIAARPGGRLQSDRADLAVLAGSEAEPVIVGLQHGAGYLFASSTTEPFTNVGLGEADNAALMLNILRRVQPGGRVAFDEYHHGFISEPSLRRLLLETPWGWAILYTAAVGGAYLLLTGRRFGRPVPLRAETGRRSSAEYLESLAGLLRRAGRADYLRQHYRASFKRRLARVHGLNPELDDAAYIEELAELHPAQARATGELLARLATAESEQALLHTVAEADRLVEGR